ncbi:helix-turn-helix domain-containing protein [Vibrio coralliilyticus]|uniref:helix-turn-helix domain-containing protein n=1 Tax=Vibrio coralliilyticus TaxID=190893 RepID=UPI001E5DAB96|nr:helix-turn-helix domain-containing protein [Vibrio coralliilyticus]MCC2522004.1 helix-turn-helix domain-containing protein [Vibrio coralliilyticus]
MNKENFSKRLKDLREERQLSQEELADVLSNSHRAFSGVNQVMISQWERGKTTPSFVRRVGLASFFQVEYDFSVEEMSQVKSATKLMNRPFNSDVAYDYEITQVDTYNFSSLPEKELALIRSMHAKLYGFDFLDTTQRFGFSREGIVVICFRSEGLLVGHFAYTTEANMFLSLGASSIIIRRQIFDYLSKNLEDTFVSFPTIDPAMSQFLYDLYFEPCCHQHGFIFYRADIKKVIENPFSQTIQNRHDVYFKYIRYHDLKQKKKSVEFLIG